MCFEYYATTTTTANAKKTWDTKFNFKTHNRRDTEGDDLTMYVKESFVFSHASHKLPQCLITA